MEERRLALRLSIVILDWRREGVQRIERRTCHTNPTHGPLETAGEVSLSNEYPTMSEPEEKLDYSEEDYWEMYKQRNNIETTERAELYAARHSFVAFDELEKIDPVIAIRVFVFELVP